MRTSNKILLIFLLSGPVLMVVTQLALYAKYKSGDLTTIKPQATPVDHKDLTGIKAITLIGVTDVHIFPSDSARMDIGAFIVDNGAGNTKTYNSPDSLAIVDSVSYPWKDQAPGYSYRTINIYLPRTMKIYASNCIVTVMGAADSTKAIGYDLVISNNTELRFETDKPIGAESSDASALRYMKDIHIDAQQSTVQINSNVVAGSLETRLANTSLQDLGASFGSLKINADNPSRVNLSGANLKKINLP